MENDWIFAIFWDDAILILRSSFHTFLVLGQGLIK